MTTTEYPQVSASAQSGPRTLAQDGPAPLTTAMKSTLGVLAAASGALAAMAFVGMFSAVRTAVRPWAHGLAWMIPAGTDLGIIILSAIAIWLEWAQKDAPAGNRLKLWWLRGLIWILIGLQLGINVGAAKGNPFGSAVHAVLPVLFISILEVWQFILRWRRGLVASHGPKSKRDRIPLARYRADFRGTREIGRHMILWNVTSYTEALDMLQKKRRAEASLAVIFPGTSDPPPQDLVFQLDTSKYLDDACDQIAKMRRAWDKGANPKETSQRRLDNIVPPGAGDQSNGRVPECCEAHQALALKQVLPMEKASPGGAADPVGNAARVNDAHIAAHGSAIGADNLRMLFKIGTPNARKLRDDLRARRKSGHGSGQESGRESAPGRGSRSGRESDASRGSGSGGDALAGVGSANGWPTGGGDV